MPEILKWFVTGPMAYFSSAISSVADFGGAMIFLPFFVALYGMRASVPILTVAVLLGNGSRVYFHWAPSRLPFWVLLQRKMPRASPGYLEQYLPGVACPGQVATRRVVP